jgi:hypothetical protein|tara:strand:- start:874 stop:1545 length:672 start_codon:yes stop_codon:yes gene_type:complete
MLRSLRLEQFDNYKKYCHLGLYGDLDSMQTSLNVIMKGAVFPLEKSISESEDEMKNDIVYEDGEELYTTVDYLDYYNNINAKTIIYNSSIISVYSFLETRLLLLCNLLDTNFSINKKDNTAYITQCKNYLSANHNIDFKLIEKDWQIILSYQTLRNELVHNSILEIPKSQINLWKIKRLRKIKHLKASESNASKIIKFQIVNKDCIHFFYTKVSKILEFIHYN